MAKRARIFDQIGVLVLLCVFAWPVWQIVHERGPVTLLLVPLGLAATSVLVVFMLQQGLEALFAVYLWFGAVALLVGSIQDLQTGFPGKKAKVNLAYADEPVLFSLAVLANVAVVAAGVIYAARWWRRREA